MNDAWTITCFVLVAAAVISSWLSDDEPEDTFFGSVAVFFLYIIACAGGVVAGLAISRLLGL